jgi:dTMP kinase
MEKECGTACFAGAGSAGIGNGAMSGRLITLEGLDGSGKATQTELLCAELSRRGARPLHVSFPDYESESSAPVRMYLNGEFGKNPEDVNAYAASSFFAVDRYASYARRWRGDYRNGALIVADRYTTSNLIYQLPKLPRGEWDTFSDWLLDFEYAKLGLPAPDLTVYLKMDPEVSQMLLDRRYHGDREKRDIHESNTAFLEACRASAAYAADRLGWRTVECVRDGAPRPAEEIGADILKIVMGELHFYASI